MRLSHDYIQDVMVEMPVMPDGAQDMKGLLRELDAAGVTGINLLELCYPLHNAEEFARRGYAIKKTPYRVLYDYWYAGGLPIAGSEEACLKVMQYAVDERLVLGVHYCSLENKFTGQIYTQDKAFAARFGHCAMSPRDYFLKCAKVFGPRAEVARDALIVHGCSAFEFDAEEQELACLPEYLGILAKVIPNEEVAIAYNVAQPSDQGVTLRELRLDLTTPATFSIEDL